MSQIPDAQHLAQLANAFERLLGRRSDPAEDAHRRGLERMVVRLAGVATAALVGAVAGYLARGRQ